MPSTSLLAIVTQSARMRAVIAKACRRCLVEESLTYTEVVACLETNLLKQALEEAGGRFPRCTDPAEPAALFRQKHGVDHMNHAVRALDIGFDHLGPVHRDGATRHADRQRLTLCGPSRLHHLHIV